MSEPMTLTQAAIVFVAFTIAPAFFTWAIRRIIARKETP